MQSILTWLDSLLIAVRALFEPAPQRERVHRGEYAWLLLLLVAAAALRFWSLGLVGLHGDEETMAMPTMGLLETGEPLLPSGMYYPRALLQIYLMAGSVTLFGESEWAMRLPSVLAGIVLVPLAFFAGRRFLGTTWNLAFTGMVAFLPQFVVDSQTARMYAFFVACLAGFLVLLFRWERTSSPGWLVLAVAVLVLGIQFHALSIFFSLLLFFPPAVRGDRRLLGQALVAFACCLGAFLAIDDWVMSFYPLNVAGYAGDPVPGGIESKAVRLPFNALAAAVLIVFAFACSLFATWSSRRDPVSWLVVSLLTASLALQAASFYHLGALLGLAALVVGSRSRVLVIRRLWPAAMLAAAMLAWQVIELRSAGVPWPRKLIGSLVGEPSPWPLLQHSQYSYAAYAIAWLGLIGALWQLARGRRVADFWLFFLLGAWIPLVAIGLFHWWVPPNYTQSALLVTLLGCCTVLQDLARRFAAGASARSAPVAIAAAAAVALVVNPVETIGVATGGYKVHPDHKGAAEYLKSQNPGPDDIVLAEDVNQQTYYLDKVDYWLVSETVAAQFVSARWGGVKDIYTGTPVIGNAPDLEALVSRRDRGTIWILGSGEEQHDGRGFARGPGISAMLGSGRFEEVHVGRDGLTRVWRIPPPAASSPAEASASQRRN